MKEAAVSFVAHSPIQNMEAICSSETSADFHHTTRSYIPEDTTLFKRMRSLQRFGGNGNSCIGFLKAKWGTGRQNNETDVANVTINLTEKYNGIQTRC
jgi:hypothetical protein